MKLALCILSLALAVPAFAAKTPPPSENGPDTIEVTELNFRARNAVTLGIVEGVTEFLPVSSTGHLIIATSKLTTTTTHFIRWSNSFSYHVLFETPKLDLAESEQQLTTPDGKLLWLKPPSATHPAGIPATGKLATDTFIVVIQFGAIAAVALLYWSQLLSMLNGLLGRDAAGRRLLVNLIVAFIPAGVVGFLAHGWIETHMFSVKAVIIAQVAGAYVMWRAERWRAAQAAGQSIPRPAGRHQTIQTPNSKIDQPAPAELSALTLKQAAGIGVLQCVALWPGTSRSMMTIVGGYFAGLDPRRSAEFSFLLGLVTLTAATIYKSYSSGAAMITVFGWPHVLLGCAVATVTAALSVRFLVTWLTKHGLMLFVWYRLAFAALLGGLLWAGFFN